jgi:hypothetical protein
MYAEPMDSTKKANENGKSFFFASREMEKKIPLEIARFCYSSS